jgi:hypothetical protein
MPLRRHEIPTHLNVEDKVLLGLTVRQVTYLMVGAAGAYALWQRWPGLPAGLRLGLAAACLAAAAALALVRPHGRGLDEWAFVALHFAAVPRACVWRPREPARSGRLVDGTRWAELAPRLDWPATWTAPITPAAGPAPARAGPPAPAPAPPGGRP